MNNYAQEIPSAYLLIMQVLKKLPVELGSILLQTSSSASGAPCTASAAGDFSLTGTRLSLLSQRVHKPGELAQHLGCASEMLSVFRFVQKSMDTPTRIKSLSDMIRYVKLYRHVLLSAILY